MQLSAALKQPVLNAQPGDERWTLWVKCAGDSRKQFDDFDVVDPLQLVSAFKKRWLRETKRDDDPSLVTLLLVPCPPGEDPSDEQERAATALSPRLTLRGAGIVNGSSLLAHSQHGRAQQAGARPQAQVCGLATRTRTSLLRSRATLTRAYITLPHRATDYSRLAAVEARLQALETSSLDPWEELPSDSSRLKKEFCEALVEYYYGDANAVAQCMVTGSTATGDKGVVAAHIWPFASSDLGLERFGLTKADKHEPRNGLLLLKEIETAFHQKRVAFFYNDARKVFQFVVLDEKLYDQDLDSSGISCDGDEPGASSAPQRLLKTFRDLQGRPLNVPPAAKASGKFPLRRLLAWHFVQSLDKQKSRPFDELSAYFPPLQDDKVRAWLCGSSPLRVLAGRHESWPRCAARRAEGQRARERGRKRSGLFINTRGKRQRRCRTGVRRVPHCIRSAWIIVNARDNDSELRSSRRRTSKLRANNSNGWQPAFVWRPSVNVFVAAGRRPRTCAVYTLVHRCYIKEYVLRCAGPFRPPFIYSPCAATDFVVAPARA